MQPKEPAVIVSPDENSLESGEPIPPPAPKQKSYVALKALVCLVIFVVGFGLGFWFKTYTYRDDRAYESKYGKAAISVYNQSVIDLIQQALILENLETELLAQALNNFNTKDFVNASYTQEIYARFENLYQQKEGHVKALNKIITLSGQVPHPPCEYNFPFRDVNGFIAQAQILDRSKTFAYENAIQEIIADGYSTASVEASYTTFRDYVTALSPLTNGTASLKDLPAISGIAATFIKSCPFEISIKPYPSFEMTPSSGPKGTEISVSSTMNTTNCAFLNGLDQIWTDISDLTCNVPETEAGNVYVFLTSDNTTRINLDSQESIVAGPEIFIV